MTRPTGCRSWPECCWLCAASPNTPGSRSAWTPTFRSHGPVVAHGRRLTGLVAASYDGQATVVSPLDVTRSVFETRPSELIARMITAAAPDGTVSVTVEPADAFTGSSTTR